MAYAVGARSKLAIGFEDMTAAYNSRTAATPKYLLPITSESINASYETVVSSALLGIRGVQTVARGRIGAEGSFDLEVYPSTSGALFYAALGKVGQGSADLDGDTLDETWNFIVPIGINDTLPTFTTYVYHDQYPFRYIGTAINSLRFSASLGNIPTMSADVIAREEEKGVGWATAPTVEPDAAPYYFTDIALYSGTDLSAVIAASPNLSYASVEFTINNNLDTDYYVFDGTGKRFDAPPGNLEITGSLEIVMDPATLNPEYDVYSQFSSYTLRIVLSKVSSTAQDTPFDRLEIYFPRIMFEEISHDVGGPERITLNASWRALIPTSDITSAVLTGYPDTTLGTRPVMIVADYKYTSGSY